MPMPTTNQHMNIRNSWFTQAYVTAYRLINRKLTQHYLLLYPTIIGVTKNISGILFHIFCDMTFHSILTLRVIIFVYWALHATKTSPIMVPPATCVRSCGTAKGLGEDPYFHIGFNFPIAPKFDSEKKYA